MVDPWVLAHDWNARHIYEYLFQRLLAREDAIYGHEVPQEPPPLERLEHVLMQDIQHLGETLP